MKFVAATAALGLLIQGLLTSAAFAQTRNCRALTEPLDRLTCNAEINPQAAARQVPPLKPSRYNSATRPDTVSDSSGMSDSADDAMVNAKINGICRGC